MWRFNIPVPVIDTGAQTAGLSYIGMEIYKHLYIEFFFMGNKIYILDPSINNLPVKFPSINNLEENKEVERDGKNSLLQSQLLFIMLHSMATTSINCIE